MKINFHLGRCIRQVYERVPHASKLHPFHVRQVKVPIYLWPIRILFTNHSQNGSANCLAQRLFSSSTIQLATLLCWAAWCTVDGCFWPPYWAWVLAIFYLVTYRWRLTWKMCRHVQTPSFAHQHARKLAKVLMVSTHLHISVFVVFFFFWCLSHARFCNYMNQPASKNTTPCRSISEHVNQQEQPCTTNSATTTPTPTVAPVSCHQIQEIQTVPAVKVEADEDCCCRL